LGLPKVSKREKAVKITEEMKKENVYQKQKLEQKNSKSLIKRTRRIEVQEERKK